MAIGNRNSSVISKMFDLVNWKEVKLLCFFSKIMKCYYLGTMNEEMEAIFVVASTFKRFFKLLQTLAVCLFVFYMSISFFLLVVDDISFEFFD